MTERQDGLANCLTNLGIDDGDDTLDTRQRTFRTHTHYRTVYELEAEFDQSWMAATEVEALPAMMFGGGFEVVNIKPDTVDAGAVRSYTLTDVEAQPDGSIDREPGINWYAWQLREQGDKAGGAALLAILDDGLDPIEPLDHRRIQRVVGWEVFDRSEITPLYSGYNAEPAYYMLSSVLAASRPSSRGPGSLPDADALRPGEVIHASRLWVHVGRTLGRRQMRNRQGWGASVLERLERERRGVEESSEYLRTYADRASWLWLSLAELDELLSRKDADGNSIGEQALTKKMRLVRRYARTLGIVPTDGGRGAFTEEGEQIPERKPDKLESITESTGDLVKIAEFDLHQWARGTGLSASTALNLIPGGLGGGDNKGDRQKEAKMVRQEQTLWATPVVDWMLTIIFASREGPTQGAIPTWETRWPPQDVPTPLEQAQVDKVRAEADAARIRSNTIEAGEVTQQRFVDGDAFGPLRVTRDEEDDVETGIGPALVGIATQVLAGAVAVGEGQLSPEFFAIYLTSIDEQRFPPDRALEIAQSIASMPLPLDEPTSDGVDAVGDEGTLDDEPPVDPLASLFADIEKGDLRQPKAIAEELTERSGMRIHTRAITDLIKRHNIQPRRVGNKTGYSLREVATVLGADRDPEAPVRADSSLGLIRRTPMMVGLAVLSDMAAAVDRFHGGEH